MLIGHRKHQAVTKAIVVAVALAPRCDEAHIDGVAQIDAFFGQVLRQAVPARRRVAEVKALGDLGAHAALGRSGRGRASAWG